MRTTAIAAVAVILLSGVYAPPLQAQRGMGDQEGVARRGIQPELVALTGEIEKVIVKPCEKTTGRATKGAHILLKTVSDDKQKTLNVHLGPADAEIVEKLVEELSEGKKVSVSAFRTEKMPEDHYVAQSLTLGEETFKLRDEETLRPVWAGDGRRGRGQPGGRGKGRGRGRGPRR